MRRQLMAGFMVVSIAEHGIARDIYLGDMVENPVNVVVFNGSKECWESPDIAQKKIELELSRSRMKPANDNSIDGDTGFHIYLISNGKKVGNFCIVDISLSMMVYMNLVFDGDKAWPRLVTILQEDSIFWDSQTVDAQVISFLDKSMIEIMTVFEALRD